MRDGFWKVWLGYYIIEPKLRNLPPSPIFVSIVYDRLFSSASVIDMKSLLGVVKIIVEFLGSMLPRLNELPALVVIVD